MPHPAHNALSNAASAYLRSAMYQPVQWQPWCELAFAQAVAEDKPVLLDIGAVWCHWCHVMDRESYEDTDLAGFINEHFIAIKVDRDERPDVDARYQAAVAAISGQGGWPLTAFLTPDGRPYFGGTYFAPEERYGQPSFRRVLMTMVASFQQSRGDVEESAASVMEAIEASESFTSDPGNFHLPEAGLALRNKLVSSALQQFDPVNGGFGSQPKFPHAIALDMLLDASSETASMQAAVLHSLHKMARGGICDQLAGGFHRYSVDERWVVPHFEKMSYDNAQLLRTYTHAFQTFADPECAETALEIMRWMNDGLSDREHGGFYASQDADLSLEHDGDYFTWTVAEAAAVLNSDEQKLAELYFDLGPLGDMKHAPARNVLFRPMPLNEAARKAGLPPESAPGLLLSARQKLLAARQQRPTPFTDRTVYTAWNGMCISAYAQAGRVFQKTQATAFAQKSLDRILDAAFDAGKVRHVVAYGDGLAGQPITDLLDDHVFLGHACLDVWEATGELRYFNAADSIAAVLLSSFYDGGEGGFYDRASDTPQTIGALSARRKPLQDSPTPAGNAAGAALLLRLHALNGKAVYRESAQKTLECFAGVVEHLGLYAGSYGLALPRLFEPAVQVVILGDGHGAAQLEAVALTGYAVRRSVIRLRQAHLQALPPTLAETLPHLPTDNGAVALVCVGRSCHPPVTNVTDLAALLQQTTAR